jgi:hypothetical protein
MIGLRPILSDSQPKNTKKACRAAAMPRSGVGGVPSTFRIVGQEEQRVELAGVPDHGLAGGAAEQGEQARSWRSSSCRRLP